MPLIEYLLMLVIHPPRENAVVLPPFRDSFVFAIPVKPNTIPLLSLYQQDNYERADNLAEYSVSLSSAPWWPGSGTYVWCCSCCCGPLSAAPRQFKIKQRSCLIAGLALSLGLVSVYIQIQIHGSVGNYCTVHMDFE
jgi:hypothetical protein